LRPLRSNSIRITAQKKLYGNLRARLSLVRRTSHVDRLAARPLLASVCAVACALIESDRWWKSVECVVLGAGLDKSSLMSVFVGSRVPRTREFAGLEVVRVMG
jgi:hypothetical protein